MLFTVSGIGPHASLKQDLDATGTNRDHYVVKSTSKITRTSSRPCTRTRKTLETIDELTTFLASATVDGIRGRLLYRGAAWSLMRKDGVLPPNAPRLGETIEADLAEHGFALLRGAMALRLQAGATELTGKAFERAANTFDALVCNGHPEAPDRGFRRIIATAACHLAGFSAVAHSLFNETTDDLNVSPSEAAIRHLILAISVNCAALFVSGWTTRPTAMSRSQAHYGTRNQMSTRRCRPFSIRQYADTWRTIAFMRFTAHSANGRLRTTAMTGPPIIDE